MFYIRHRITVTDHQTSTCFYTLFRLFRYSSLSLHHLRSAIERDASFTLNTLSYLWKKLRNIERKDIKYDLFFVFVFANHSWLSSSTPARIWRWWTLCWDYKRNLVVIVGWDAPRCPHPDEKRHWQKALGVLQVGSSILCTDSGGCTHSL